MTKWHGGKGSKRRPEDKKRFEDNFDRIFGKKGQKGFDGAKGAKRSVADGGSIPPCSTTD